MQHQKKNQKKAKKGREGREEKRRRRKVPGESDEKKKKNKTKTKRKKGEPPCRSTFNRSFLRECLPQQRRLLSSLIG